ncbi:MAG: chemotaxis protein CheA [Bryobacterales bacterium]|nr:chemotaxis protein CheA [Bryobacterales bacterium]
MALLAEGTPAAESAAPSSLGQGDPDQGDPDQGDPDQGDPEMLREFVGEAAEHLATIETAALDLERNPGDQEALRSLFRSFHTMKGVAGFLALSQIRDLTHRVESTLDLARNGKIPVGEPLIEAVLIAGDWLRQAVENVHARLLGKPAPPLATPDHVLAKLQAATEASAAQTATDGGSCGTSGMSGRNSLQTAVKVDTAKLDYLVDMVGELVIAESMVVNSRELRGIDSVDLQRKLALVTQVTTEVQRTAMGLRMVTIGQLFRKMERVVRDLSRKLSKPINFEVSGEDTELDRTLVEQLADPLLHMVRNAIDHGIEPAEARQAAGKPETGLIALSASHVSGQIVIEVRDDGAGLNTERIRAKAVASGVVAPGAVLSDYEIHNLIFEAGFSTATQVTDVSGRGVGLDVVKKAIQALRGRVEIHSRPGQGSTFLLKLPLTLAIIDGLIAAVGTERYILPMVSVREMLRPDVSQLSTLGKDEMVLVRGRLLPVIRLHERLGVVPRKTRAEEALLVIIEGERATFALMVDEFLGKQEVVIKSLGKAIAYPPAVSAGAILGDGRVGLILDLEVVFGGGVHA